MNEHSPEPSFFTSSSGKLLIATVARGRGEKVMAVAKAAGARGGTIMLGRSSVESTLLRLLSLDDKEVDIVLILLSSTEMAPVCAALCAEPLAAKLGKGFIMGLEAGKILRHVPLPLSAPQASSPGIISPNPEPKRISMSADSTHELISIIVNTGYADDLMAVARAAGAPGGTIINARGTGKEEDVKFFGLTIVPEKEFIMILVPKEKAGEVLVAVKTAPCLNQPGLGIACCLDGEFFAPLGTKTHD
jgi:nitrogen regulatory protein PII